MPRVIITIPDKNAQPYRFQLDRKVVSLGRGSDNDIVIDSGSVSGKHAEMKRVEGGYELEDLGSTNGIKVDGTRQQKVTLRSGMALKLGDVVFDFTLTDEEQETLASEKPEDRLPPLPDAPAEAAPDPDGEAPEPKRGPRPARAHEEPAEKSVSTGMIVLFVILAAAAFFAGLSIRHQKITGESLIKAMTSVETPAAPATDAPPAAEDAEQ